MSAAIVPLITKGIVGIDGFNHFEVVGSRLMDFELKNNSSTVLFLYQQFSDFSSTAQPIFDLLVSKKLLIE